MVPPPTNPLTRTSYIGYAYWGAILLMGMCSRLCTWMIYRRKPRIGCDLESHVYPRTAMGDIHPRVVIFLHWVRTHLLVPAPIARCGRNLLGCTFSTRAEALVIGGFWLLSVILSVVGYRTFSGNI